MATGSATKTLRSAEHVSFCSGEFHTPDGLGRPRRARITARLELSYS
jgi:hypothetical protein